MHDRDMLKIKTCKSNDPNDWTHLKKLHNIVNSEIRLAKQAYYQNSFNQYTWQNLAVILILQMVMFIRGTSPAQTNVRSSVRQMLTKVIHFRIN